MDITVSQFEQDNRDLIEYWLDHARYKPTSNVQDTIPKKLDANCSRSFRRFALLRRQVQLLRQLDLTKSRRVIDIGAGFGDFAMIAKYYNFEQFDATDPSMPQYNFLTKYMKDYYHNIFDLGIEDIDLQDYDTAILAGVHIPNYRIALEKYIFNTNIHTLVIRKNFLNIKNVTEISIDPVDPSPWRYNKEAEWTAIGENFLNSIMRSCGFIQSSKLELLQSKYVSGNNNSRYIIQYTKK